jgi:taurine dioxygenase
MSIATSSETSLASPATRATRCWPIYQHAENPLFQFRFRWTENAFAFWDNRCARHRAMWDYQPHIRAGTRVTVKGERPV